MRLQEIVLNLMKRVMEMPVSEMQASLREMKDAGLNIRDCLDFMQLWFRDILMFKATKDTSLFIFKDEYKYIRRSRITAPLTGLKRSWRPSTRPGCGWTPM